MSNVILNLTPQAADILSDTTGEDIRDIRRDEIVSRLNNIDPDLPEWIDSIQDIAEIAKEIGLLKACIAPPLWAVSLFESELIKRGIMPCYIEYNAVQMPKLDIVYQNYFEGLSSEDLEVREELDKQEEREEEPSLPIVEDETVEESREGESKKDSFLNELLASKGGESEAKVYTFVKQ